MKRFFLFSYPTSGPPTQKSRRGDDKNLPEYINSQGCPVGVDIHKKQQGFEKSFKGWNMVYSFFSVERILIYVWDLQNCDKMSDINLFKDCFKTKTKRKKG